MLAEPAVPFALLGTVTLLAVAGWAVLAAAGVALRGLRLPALLLLLGAGTLATVEVRLAVSFSERVDDPLALTRAAGALLLAAGIALGALDDRHVGTGAPAEREPAALGVVVPLGAAVLPASAAALATLAAAALLPSRRTGPPAWLLSAGLVAHAAAAALSTAAGTSADAATGVLVLRGAGAALLLAGTLALGRRSLLAKVVAALLAGVLFMASAAVAVVGTAVSRSFGEQATALVRDTAAARAAELADEASRLQPLAEVLSNVQQQQPGQLDAALGALGGDAESFFVEVRGVGSGAPVTDVRAPASPVFTAEQEQALARLELVADAAASRLPVPGLVVLPGTAPLLVNVVAKPVLVTGEEVTVVHLYGVPVQEADLEVVGAGDEGYALALLAGTPPVTAVSAGLSDGEAAEVEARAGTSTRSRTLPAEGDTPTLHLQRLATRDRTPVLLAVARSADVALEGQRSALAGLLLSALAATAAAGVLAVLLGRRTVDPVRRLTAAAERVAAGDLTTAPPPVRSDDEVGTLSRTFSTMTTALATLTGDLRSTAGRLETVLASMTDGLLATDGAGTVTSANRAALEMLGREQVVGLPLVEVADVRDADGARLADPSLRLADAPGEVHRPDGSTLPVRVAVSDLLEGEGVVVVLRDTTREREVERMKTEFLSNVSHELRTPLTPIRGYADILATRSEKLAPPQVATFAGTILSETLKMNRVVDLLVDVAALEAGRVRLRPRDVDVRELVDARLAAWRVRAPARADDLKRRVAAGLPTVHVDPEWVAKALDELLDNAVKYTTPGTPVTLTATPSPDGAHVRVAVRDAGPGIPEADRAVLFTSFEQVDGSATRRVGGLGLGLSFVRRLAEDTGLGLSVQSVLGRGSEFALDLPPGAAPVPAPRRRAASARR